MSHVVPTKQCQQNIGGENVKYFAGEVLVGQSANARLGTQEGLRPQSSSISHNHQNGPRPSTSSTISSDHFSSDYFSSNTSHEYAHNEQVQDFQPGSNRKSGAFLHPQNTATMHHQERDEMGLPNENQTLNAEQNVATKIMQPGIIHEKNIAHYMPVNITQYHHHNQVQNCRQGAEYECQRRAAAKLCAHLSQNYDSGEPSGENSNSEYSEDDEEYEEDGYAENRVERKMAPMQPSTQNPSILKSLIHSDEAKCYGQRQSAHITRQPKHMISTGTQDENSPVQMSNLHNPQKTSKAQRGSQTYYEDQATQTEDEEEDEDICHKHGCRYRRLQSLGQQESNGLSGSGNK